jgi:hypothetical protein
LLGPVVTAAKRAGVRHIVLISAFGVNHNEEAPLRIVEHLVIDSGVPYTILRPNFFMENFTDGFLKTSIREQNAIYLSAGNGKTRFFGRGYCRSCNSNLEAALTGRNLTSLARLRSITLKCDDYWRSVATVVIKP